MFRRKEDSLFDNSTDPNQVETEEDINVKSDSNSASSAQSSGTPAYLNSQQASRSPERPAASAPASATSFRQSTPASQPATSDISRNRLPETKPATPSSASSSLSAGSSFSAQSINKSGKRVLTVGNDILLKGEIATCDRLVIEGKVDATLNDVHTVEIAESGSFKGAAQIEDAEISGLFEGDLIVRNRLVIYSTGQVRGNITYGEIEIERGGELTGEIKSSSSGSQSASRPARKEERVAA
ncbi:MAG: bactofilin family protein [Rickettsiales bacterium]